MEDKPTVAVDIDEVLFPMAPTFLEYHNHEYGTNLRLDQMASYYVEALTGETYEQMQAKIQAYLKTEHYTKGKPIAGAVESIRKLREKFSLALITSRDHFYRGSTETFLETHFLGLYDELHYTHTIEEPSVSISKYVICKNIGAIAMIDDSLSNILECAKNGVPGILFGDYPWNQADELPNGVIRVKNWQEVLEYLNAAG